MAPRLLGAVLVDAGVVLKVSEVVLEVVVVEAVKVVVVDLVEAAAICARIQSI